MWYCGICRRASRTTLRRLVLTSSKYATNGAKGTLMTFSSDETGTKLANEAIAFVRRIRNYYPDVKAVEALNAWAKARDKEIIVDDSMDHPDNYGDFGQ